MTPVSSLFIVVAAVIDHFVAGDIVYFDPDSQTTFVYNLGDMAWIIAAMGKSVHVLDCLMHATLTA